MFQVTVHSGEEVHILQAQPGENLLELLRRSGLAISAPCGGKGACGKCRVELSDGTEILSCGTAVNAPMTIRLPSFEGGGLTAFSAAAQGSEGHASAALDIGTTTLAAAITDPKTGEVLAARATLNPQQVCGADVISRICACGEGKLELQKRLVRQAAATLLDSLQKQTGIPRIHTLTVCANTTMLHIFCGEDPTSIGHAPYTPVFTRLRTYTGAALELNVDRVYVLPSASGYIGADVICGAVTLDSGKGPWLLADLGTNGELALCHNGAFTCASTAAGPALEGANIECGLGGVPGAICAANYEDGQLRLRTIDDRPPTGICGSGLADLVALLVNTGVIDETGCFDEECPHPLAQKLADDRFLITDSIWLSQKDVRQFQLAKAAIFAGITTLCSAAGIAPEQLERLYIAGGLGFYLREASALDAGLIPRAFEGRITPLGNSALAGALQCLNDSARARACTIADSAKILDLNGNPEFSDHFVEAMSFE